MSYNPTIRERIEKSGIQPLKEMVKEIDSAQQEWTPEYVKELFGGGSFPHFAFFCRISQAHNAILAAERQTSDGLGKLNDELRGQLLSAQAAIEKHNEMWKNPAFQVDQIKVDLSALNHHDAKVRKPLLKAILDLAGMTDDWPTQPPSPLAKQIATDALSKVKETV